MERKERKKNGRKTDEKEKNGDFVTHYYSCGCYLLVSVAGGKERSTYERLRESLIVIEEVGGNFMIFRVYRCRSASFVRRTG